MVLSEEFESLNPFSDSFRVVLGLWLIEMGNRG